jgi:hypothetical protein
MESKIINMLKEEERATFLKLEPAARILRMEKVLHEILAAKAEDEGVTEGEIYKRYLARHTKRRRAIQ